MTNTEANFKNVTGVYKRGVSTVNLVHAGNTNSDERFNNIAQHNTSVVG